MVGRRSQRTQEEITAAALRLFAFRGFKTTTIDEICQSINLTKGALYWHFRSKQDLFGAILNRIKTRWQNVVIREINAQSDPLLRVEALFDGYALLLADEPEICLFLQRILLDGKKAHADTVRAVFAGTAREIAKIFDEGVRQGVFRSDVDTHLIAQNVVTGLAGAQTHCLDNPGLSLKEIVQELKLLVLSRLHRSAADEGLPGKRGPHRKEPLTGRSARTKKPVGDLPPS